jgi:hypothetical protein
MVLAYFRTVPLNIPAAAEVIHSTSVRLACLMSEAGTRGCRSKQHQYYWLDSNIGTTSSDIKRHYIQSIVFQKCSLMNKFCVSKYIKLHTNKTDCARINPESTYQDLVVRSVIVALLSTLTETAVHCNWQLSSRLLQSLLLNTAITRTQNRRLGMTQNKLN